jgi:RNA polymerase sigma factor (TIGR02999 family)
MVTVETPDSSEITALLKAWTGGDRAAFDRLAPIVYEELRRMARGHMRHERAGHTLQTTAVVNELYLRLVDVRNVDWQHRAQFFAISAQIMRRILVDAARARRAQKRGSRAEHVNIDEAAVHAREPEESIVALDAVLEEFAKMAPRQARVVELRYFAGLSEEEIAGITGTTTRTVERDWRFARSWLMRELSR